MKKSEYLLKITLIGALGGLLFGYDTAVISGAIGFIESKFSLNAAVPWRRPFRNWLLQE